MNVPPQIIFRLVFVYRRCVKGEGEIEKLQAKVVELRRKLDDTTAAMQELGRENQSLQVNFRKTKILEVNSVFQNVLLLLSLIKV